MSNGSEPAGWSVTLEFAPAEDGVDALRPFEDALTPPELDGRAATTLVHDQGSAVSRLTAMLPGQPEDGWLSRAVAKAEKATGRRPRSISVERLPVRDWVAEADRARPAVSVGPFYLRGSHIPPAAADRLDILIDAGRAFGTGAHETTQGCLAVLAGAEPPAREAPILDLGAGSGILAIAMARLWRRDVIAADDDPIAVVTARGNAARNGTGKRIRVHRSPGFANSALRRAGPFGLIVANILARPLIRMAPSIVRNLREDGRVVLSGLLTSQEEAVADAYLRLGMVVQERVLLGDWPTLSLSRESAR